MARQDDSCEQGTGLSNTFWFPETQMHLIKKMQQILTFCDSNQSICVIIAE